MKSKLKLISAIFAFSLSVLLFHANALSTSSMYIYSPDTKTGTTIYFGPQPQIILQVPATTTTITSTTTTSTTSTNCLNYISTFHKYGDTGADVVKLQMFLNEFQGAKLNLKGNYGKVTEMEIRNLQFTYDIKVTGVQHEKTTALINSLKCGNITKKAKKTYVFAANTYSGMGTNIRSNQVNYIDNLYPAPPKNIPVKNVVKEYTNKNPKNDSLVKFSTSTKIKATTTPTFWENIKKDWVKVKENYKAYALVFLLVLALFWFLRKAATE